MFRAIINKFNKCANRKQKTTKNNDNAAAAPSTIITDSTQFVVLCSKCYFVTSANVSIKDYIELHNNYNEKFVDECSSNFIITNSKYWKKYENCSAFYIPLC
ncbi:hypothetical protein [Lonomia obliqua multiple nucleopolyhedrovirus]|uniref:Uncharacterized protein n=1 Tax=Lonomia obliqua multiple nucleopolyhedrovirus TaxID=134394 RepID=A0A126FCG9_9ABAC|nr:hypothetical protein [Lonomia obliqua multiple nucleopolyhedrovirus]AKN81055.1 hypothetical protein [Lonomia obliqua multiple nucleopolyhedrovirus]